MAPPMANVDHETDFLLRIADDLEFHGEQCHQMAWRIREQWQAAHDSQAQDGTGKSRSRSPHRATLTQSHSGRTVSTRPKAAAQRAASRRTRVSWPDPQVRRAAVAAPDPVHDCYYANNDLMEGCTQTAEWQVYKKAGKSRCLKVCTVCMQWLADEEKLRDEYTKPVGG